MNPSDPAGHWMVVMACGDTIARAARLTDMQDHTGFAALFTEHAELHRPDGSQLHGRAAILSAYQARPADRMTRHLLAGSVVDVVNDHEARASTNVLLYRAHTDDPAGPFGRPSQGPALVGEFDDRLVREADGQWRIARRLARFLVHTLPTP